MDGIGQLKGWQWLFLIEGALTVVMGIYVAFTLADLPSNVSTVNVVCFVLQDAGRLHGKLETGLILSMGQSSDPHCSLFAPCTGKLFE